MFHTCVPMPTLISMSMKSTDQICESGSVVTALGYTINASPAPKKMLDVIIDSLSII